MAVTEQLNRVVALEIFWQILMGVWAVVVSWLAFNGVNIYESLLPKEAFELFANEKVYYSTISASVAIVLLNGYLVWALKKARYTDNAKKLMEWVYMEWVFLYLLASSLVIFMVFAPIKLWMYTGKPVFLIYKYWSIKTVESYSKTVTNKKQ